jgi:tryptophan 2,3-dioxygenase
VAAAGGAAVAEHARPSERVNGERVGPAGTSSMDYAGGGLNSRDYEPKEEVKTR